MPNDRDAAALEGFQKCLHLPQFLTCGICGAVCDQQSAPKHAEWHDSPPAKGSHNPADCPRCDGSYFIVTEDDEYNCDCECHS